MFCFGFFSWCCVISFDVAFSGLFCFLFAVCGFSFAVVFGLLMRFALVGQSTLLFHTMLSIFQIKLYIV